MSINQISNFSRALLPTCPSGLSLDSLEDEDDQNLLGSPIRYIDNVNKESKVFEASIDNLNLNKNHVSLQVFIT